MVGIGLPIKFDVVESLSEDDAVEKLLDLYIKETERLFEELKVKTGRRKHVKLKIEVLQTRKVRKEEKKKKV